MEMRRLRLARVVSVAVAAANLSFAVVGRSPAFVGGGGRSRRAGGSVLRLEAGTFDPLVNPPPSPELPLDRGTGGAGDEEVVHFIVQFEGPIRDEVKAQIEEMGAVVLGYLPENALLVSGRPALFEEVREEIGSIRWTGPWIPQYKISSALRVALRGRGREGRHGSYVAVLFAGSDLGSVTRELGRLGAEVLQVVDMSAFGGERRFSDRVVFRCGARDVFAVAGIASVAWIEPLLIPEKRNDASQWVVQTNVTDDRSIWQHRIFGTGQIIGHIDGPLDRNSCYFRDDDHPIGPDHRKIVAYRSSSGYGADAHGTHTAGTAAGEAIFAGGDWTYDGMAPGAKISHSNLDDVNNANLAEYLLWAYQDGAMIHTNSWGNDWSTAYTQWCRDIDQVSHDYEDNLICFAVTNLNALRTPENAKDVLAVGATSRAPDQDMYCTGGAGPTSDGRRKPDIYAPGCDVMSARGNLGCATWSMSGTSMAAPAVAGAGALVREYFEEGWYPTGTSRAEDAVRPTGALVKAVLLNSAVDMTGVAGYPSDREGWGRVLLENALYFQGDTRGLIVRDVRMAEGLSTGDREVISFGVAGSGSDLRVTLVWHDYPAAVGASFTPVNDLDLFVRSPGGTIYRGNVFSGGCSVPGGESDRVNDVEQVHVRAPEVGEWGLMVRGHRVNMGPQGYALVITGDVDGVGPTR